MPSGYLYSSIHCNMATIPTILVWFLWQLANIRDPLIAEYNSDFPFFNSLDLYVPFDTVKQPHLPQFPLPWLQWYLSPLILQWHMDHFCQSLKQHVPQDSIFSIYKFSESQTLRFNSIYMLGIYSLLICSGIYSFTHSTDVYCISGSGTMHTRNLVYVLESMPEINK